MFNSFEDGSDESARTTYMEERFDVSSDCPDCTGAVDDAGYCINECWNVEEGYYATYNSRTGQWDSIY